MNIATVFYNGPTIIRICSQEPLGEGGTLSVTDGEVPLKSLRLQAVPKLFVENVYPVSEFSIFI